MKTDLSLYDRTLTLFRYPKRNNETLQAWDAGDEYLIQHVEEMGLADGQKILVLNDSFGALSCWLSDKHHVTMMTDSFIAQQAAQNNLAENQCNAVQIATSLDAIPTDVDLVIMQIPRNNRYLTWQLTQLRNALPSNVAVVAVNKAKDIHSSTLKLFEKYLGETKTSLAWKKHRLVFCHANSAQAAEVDAFTTWSVDEHNITLKNLANVYSGESLDQGARFILQNLPADDTHKRTIDLGCGNGVLSVKLAQLNPNMAITCVDESFMAVASAEQNLIDNVGQEERFQCIANNCLDGMKEADYDLVVCNPPFHQQQAVTDHIAWQMFCDARHVLSTGGQLLVIGNRHLGYDVKLKRLFGKSNVSVVAVNKKFVILQATK
ncbi:ribosomal RNA small subunit methyltransferase C [Vibrio ichthyoenteri ATCC 700023]|uniref:Ribosomal RNA large subunit methyltransferase G n=1 Tax=Vibrio ichthyoenteri ATCC 700023 TaxID=870968 RepID=F9S0V1_9VIBR|nr:methyltransferase [Vibrio ichthyoenteri]EGU42934.1 ribosomal RNA small subunit methyltransferase C [Vibrio ichthyoenteri ATCC 700023]